MNAGRYYWCLTHGRVEGADERDDVDNALGPYDTREDAQNWKAINEARAEAWKAEDEAWDGPDEDGDGDA